MQARIAALSEASGAQLRGIVRLPGEQSLPERGAGKAQFNLVMRASMPATERVLVDAAQLTQSTGVPHAVNWFVPSWDGRRLAYGVSAGGSEDASMRVIDVASGQALIDPVSRVHQGSTVAWTPDSRGLAYNQLKTGVPGEAAAEDYMDTTVFLLAPVKRGGTARPLFGPKVNPELKLGRLDVAGVSFTLDGHFMLARTTDTTVPEGKLFVAPVAALSGSGPIAWVKLSDFDDKTTAAQMHGDTLYLRTAPGRRAAACWRWTSAHRYSSAPAMWSPSLSRRVGEHGDRPRCAVRRRARRLQHASAALLAGRRAARRRGARPEGQRLRRGRRRARPRDVWFTTSTWTEPSRVMRTTAPGRYEDTGLRDARTPAGAPDLDAQRGVRPQLRRRSRRRWPSCTARAWCSTAAIRRF